MLVLKAYVVRPVTPIKKREGIDFVCMFSILGQVRLSYIKYLMACSVSASHVKARQVL